MGLFLSCSLPRKLFKTYGETLVREEGYQIERKFFVTFSELQTSLRKQLVTKNMTSIIDDWNQIPRFDVIADTYVAVASIK